MSEKPPRNDHERHTPADQNEHGGNRDQQPSQERRWWLVSRPGIHGPAQQSNANRQMDARETGAEGGHPANDIVEDRQQPKVFRIFVHHGFPLVGTVELNINIIS